MTEEEKAFTSTIHSMTKLTVVSRVDRVVTCAINDTQRIFCLSKRPRCNAGDVQRRVNLAVGQGNYGEAYVELMRHID